MSGELPDIERLISDLKSKNRTDLQIIDILSSIIKQQLMYGGSIFDKVNYWVHNVKSKE